MSFPEQWPRGSSGLQQCQALLPVEAAVSWAPPVAHPSRCMDTGWPHRLALCWSRCPGPWLCAQKWACSGGGRWWLGV